MKFIEKLTKQILATQKMIDDTKKLLIENKNDDMLLFMLKQDEALLKSLKQQRTQELLEYFKKPGTTVDSILCDVFTSIPFEIDPATMAQKMGIKLLKNPDMEDDTAGKCYIDDEIVIEYKPASPNRERFTISHEMAHIIKHMPYRAANNAYFTDSATMLYARNDYVDSGDMTEEEADKVAGNILIPKVNIDKLIDSLEPLEQISTKLLCDLFKVSEGAMYHALKNYGLLNSPKIKEEFSWSIQTQ